MSAGPRSDATPGLPPGPRLPPGRQTARWLSRPDRFLCDLQQRHGDVFTIRLLREKPWVVVGNPELVKPILTAPADVLHAGEPKRILEPVLGPESILLNDGAQHMRQRRLLLPLFHAARLGRYEQSMRGAAEAEIGRWPRGVAAPAAPRMSAIALEVVLRSVFGLGGDPEAERLREPLGRLVHHLAAHPRAALVALGDPARLGRRGFAPFRAAIERADAAIRVELGRRRAAAPRDGEDVLSLLLAAHHDDGSPMSDRELRDELMSLLIAGHETTAASLAWALERLVRHPRALERTEAEAAAGGGPYTEAVVQEVLRLRPPFMHLARDVKQPFRLGAYLLPPEVTIAVGIPLVHGHPDVYPDPEAFRPERFLERPPGTYTWIPFGGGIRRCIGAGFALLEMRAVLSTLLFRAGVRAAGGGSEPPARRLLVMAPSRDARIVLEPR